MFILYIGVILLVGFIFSIISEKIGLPKIVGYLIAGIVLNPELFGIIPNEFLEITNVVTSFCLAFITFEIGNSFSLSELKLTGKKYFSLAIFESFGAFLFLFAIFFAVSILSLPLSAYGITTSIAFSLILASLGAPTDPSATLAVIHEYKAKGPVTNAVLGAAAFDDIITLILFSFSISISSSILGSGDITVPHIIYGIVYKIVGAVASGIIFGFIFNKLLVYLKIGERSSILILFIAFIAVTFGLAKYLEFDELFATLTLGFVTRNFNKQQEKIINISENGLENLIFLIFFVFSAMNFKFDGLNIITFILIFTFILTRLIGKYTGMKIGTNILNMPKNVKKYAFAGLIPQGGIVLGLSLTVNQEPLFNNFGNLLVGIIMGATILHEFVGPLISRFVLKKAGELGNKQK